MIAAFLATKVGRIVAAIAAGVVAVLTFGAWQRREGRQAEQQRQKDNDHAAVVRAGKADGDYRAGGGAAGSLQRGDF